MLLSCVYRYKLKGFNFKSPKFSKQGRLSGGEMGVRIQVLRESTASSTTTAPGSRCIPAGLSAAIQLKSNSPSKRRVLDIVPSQCKALQVLRPVFKCTSIDLEPHKLTFCTTSVTGQGSNTELMIRPVRHSTCRWQFNEVQIKAHSQLIT